MNGKAYIVTGAASGIGRAAAKLLASRGAKVIIADISDGEMVAKEIRGDGGEAFFVQTDVSCETSVKSMVATAIEKFGRLDGAFNNAGVPLVAKPLHEISLEEWQRCQAINSTGTFLCIKYQVPEMLKMGGGAIVNTASIASFVNVPFGADYVASKHSVAGITKAAANDYGLLNIRVNAVAPGSVQTPMLQKAFDDNEKFEEYCNDQHPIGRFAQPAEIAAAAVWLLSDEASFITGTVVPVDGGYTSV